MGDLFTRHRARLRLKRNSKFRSPSNARRRKGCNQLLRDHRHHRPLTTGWVVMGVRGVRRSFVCRLGNRLIDDGV